MAITVETRTQVSQLYTALFGRAPDYDGLGFWTTLIGGGKSLTDVADLMYATTPARGYFPIFFSNEEIIASFYLNVLGRVADAEGLAFWTAHLDAGRTAGSVIVEMIAVVANYAGTNAAGLVSKQLFNNKVTVAQYYAESGGDAEGATDILSGVTNDPASVTAAFEQIDGVDTIKPVFDSAVVDGATLVMSYTDANALDAEHAPAAGAFAVTVAGVARTVNSVVVDTEAKTVTLTLASAVTNGQVVTVAYTDPTTGDDAAAIQDASGNDAATLAAASVTNTTPVPTDVTGPAFVSASVTGTALVITYSDAASIDAAHIPSVNAFAVTVSGSARAVSSIAVDAEAMTVTLTLASAVTGGQVVTVAYTDPTTGNDANAIQDTLGNDAASMAATAVTTVGTDAAGPLFSSATVTGAILVMSYLDSSPLDPFNDPAVGAFEVKVGGVLRAVSEVDIDSSDKTVTLTLASAVGFGEAVTVGYTDPTGDDDLLALQDAFGNDAATLSPKTVTNSTPDTVAPVFASATVSGATLVMTYTDASKLDAVNEPATTAFAVKVEGVARTVSSVAVNATDKTVTLTLASAVTHGQAVTVAYTDPSSANNPNAIQDALGNDAATLAATAVTNTTADVTAPAFASAAVSGDTLVLNFTDLNDLDTVNEPAAGAFTVTVGGVTDVVTNVVVGADGTVTLTLTTAVTNGQTVSLAYADPTNGNDLNALQDVAGNDVVSLVGVPVTNNTVPV